MLQEMYYMMDVYHLFKEKCYSEPKGSFPSHKVFSRGKAAKDEMQIASPSPSHHVNYSCTLQGQASC